jgi:hypothetical protein
LQIAQRLEVSMSKWIFLVVSSALAMVSAAGIGPVGKTLPVPTSRSRVSSDIEWLGRFTTIPPFFPDQ